MEIDRGEEDRGEALRREEERADDRTMRVGCDGDGAFVAGYGLNAW